METKNATGAEHKGDHQHEDVVHYFVNGEAQKSAEDELTVRVILTNAGFTPPEDYHLTRDKDHHTFTSLDDKVELHEGEKFTATFVGPTPTS